MAASLCGNLCGLLGILSIEEGVADSIRGFALLFCLGVASSHRRCAVAKRTLHSGLRHASINGPLAETMAEVMDSNVNLRLGARGFPVAAKRLVSEWRRNRRDDVRPELWMNADI